MLQMIIALVSGVIFGWGLLWSGLASPAKVLGFLDVVGRWDPSLALVMIGAIGVAALPLALAKKCKQSWVGLPMQLPAARSLDRRLIIGSLVFGIGWGLAGICPGPAFVLLGMGIWQGALFVAAMLVGMAIFAWLEQHRNKAAIR